VIKPIYIHKNGLLPRERLNGLIKDIEKDFNQRKMEFKNSNVLEVFKDSLINAGEKDLSDNAGFVLIMQKAYGTGISERHLSTLINICEQSSQQQDKILAEEWKRECEKAQNHQMKEANKTTLGNFIDSVKTKYDKIVGKNKTENQKAKLDQLNKLKDKLEKGELSSKTASQTLTAITGAKEDKPNIFIRIYNAVFGKEETKKTRYSSNTKANKALLAAAKENKNAGNLLANQVRQSLSPQNCFLSTQSLNEEELKKTYKSENKTELTKWRDKVSSETPKTLKIE
jgi:hypothetical protein